MVRARCHDPFHKSFATTRLYVQAPRGHREPHSSTFPKTDPLSWAFNDLLVAPKYVVQVSATYACASLATPKVPQRCGWLEHTLYEY